MALRKNILWFVFLILVFTVNGQNSEPSHIRIKISPVLGESVNLKNTSSGYINTGIVALDRLTEKYSVTKINRVFPYSPKFEARHKKHGLHLWYDIEVNDPQLVPDMISDFGNIAEVTKTELRQAPKLIDPGVPVIYNGPIMKSANASLPFNDPLLDKQWHYNNYGQSGGTPRADIRLFDAWRKATGSPNVIVSIHDMGVDLEHEDLKDALWTNEAEMNGKPGVDDDQNGFIDDIHGWNFSENKATIPAEYHATHVAGTIAATNNNGKGVSGIAGGTGNKDGVKIMSCRILGGPIDFVPNSFIYAADNGAVISQNSWGFPNADETSQAMQDAIDYFIEEAGNYPGSPMKGGVVIFAVGNLGLEGKFYPAAYDKCVSVTALGSQNIRAPYANYGDWVDIAAPGGNTNDDTYLKGKDKSYSNGIMSTLDGNDYGFLDGTSMACPHISGIAALIASKFQGPTFTNTELLTHLLTAYNDSIYNVSYNKEFKGKLGSGLADANLALATDNKIAPDKVTDLKLTGEMAQDFVVIEWTAPKDADDGKPTNYEIIYSKEDITADKINKATILPFKNDSLPGKKMRYEIDGLSASTFYNFSVRYIDRWGNKAPFSNIVSAKTNEGPIVKHLGDSINISINVKKEKPVKTDSFVLVNEGEGLLRWNLEARHSEGIPYNVHPAVRFEPVTLEAYAAKKGILMSVPESPITAYNIENDHDEEYSDLESDAHLIVLGETNTKLPNSSATRFKVPNKNGFNLTHVDAFLVQKDTTSGKVVLEIYEGEDIKTAKLVLSQKIPKITMYRFTRVQLEDQLFFNYNSTFWVVIHVPPGNLYPLGAGFEATPEGSKNAFLSNDYGKTWSLLEDVIPDNNIVWAVYAMSRYQKLDTYVKLSPDKGELSAGDSVTVTATVDGKNMVDGNYRGNILVNTNEKDRKNFRIPVDVKITGHDPKIKSASRVDFGTELLGNATIAEFKFKNEGLSRFDIAPPFFTFTDPQFSYVQGVVKEFDAGDELTVYFKYKPTKAGVSIADATMLDKNGDNYTFELFGVGLEPPVIAVKPPDTTYTNLTIGDTVKSSFVIKNTGKYTLDYFMPKFDDGANVKNVPANIHRFGYRTTLNQGGGNPNGLPFVWNDISSTGVDITREILNKFGRLREVPNVGVDIGFAFPFFGTNEDSVYITSYGYLTFDFNDYMWSRTPLFYGDTLLTDRHISIFGASGAYALQEDVKIYYQKYPDKLVVQYDKAPISDEYDVYATVTCQVVLFDNGDIRFYYKDAIQSDWYKRPDGLTVFDVATMIGIEDQHQKDGVYIHDTRQPWFKFLPQSTIEFINPGLGLYFDLSKTHGSIKPGKLDTIQYKIKTDELTVDKHNEVLTIISNDPAKPADSHLAILDVVHGAEPIISLSLDTLDFQKVFLKDTRTFEVVVTNSGKAPATLTGINVGPGFKVDGIALPYLLKALKKVTFKVSINTDKLGKLTDIISVNTNIDSVYTVHAMGEIVPAPAITVNPTSISQSVISGNQLKTNLKVSNPGQNELEFSLQGNDWLTVATQNNNPGAFDVKVPEFDYHVTKSTETGGPGYEWVELAENDSAKYLEDVGAYKNNFSDRIELPFAFNYYGVDYTSLFICANGFVTFSEGQDRGDRDYSWGGVRIPNTDLPNNYIAPFWMGGGPDFKDWYPYSGVHYVILEDRIIVEFKDYLNGYQMGVPISFEVILFKNGNIKFQYKFINGNDTEDFNMNYGVIGIENQDGTDGKMISFNSRVVRKDMSILLVPLAKYKIPAGGNMDFDVNLDARKLYQGSYKYDMPVLNNAPSGRNLKVPVTLNVSGTAVMEAPDSIEFGEQLIVNTIKNKHIREFEIKNTGTAQYRIIGMVQSNPEGFTFDAYLPVTNDITGETAWVWTNLFQGSSTISDQVPILLLARQTLKCRVTFDPKTAKSFKDDLYLSTTIFNQRNDTISFYGAALMPPIVNTDTTFLGAYAESDNVVETKSFVLDNFKGGSDLKYSINIEYKRSSNSNNSAGQAFSNDKLKSAGMSPVLQKLDINHLKTKSGNSTSEIFNRVLSYENASEAEINLGFGGGFVMKSATRFTAPADGFKLSHIQTWYAPGDLLNSSFTVNIYDGSKPIGTSKIYTQQFNYKIDSPDPDGKLVTVELKQPITFFPGESFFVEILYGKEQIYPQGLVTIPVPKTNTFFFGNDAQYFDMSESDFSDYAWIIRAAELEYSGSTWALLNSSAKGVLKPGEETSVSLNFIAQYASQGINSAYLHIQSNDPVTPDKVVELQLSKNKGPQFDLNGTDLVMLETDTLTFEVMASDEEGDDFNITVEDIPGFVQATVEGHNVKVICTPGYEDANIYSLIFKATDAHFNSNSIRVGLEVINKNRPPVANKMETIVIGIDESSYALNGLDLFTDPDNNTVTLRFVQDQPSVFETFESGNNFLFAPKELGESKIKFYGSDPYGGSAINELKIVVTSSKSSGAGRGYFEPYPNPVNSILYFSTHYVKVIKTEVSVINSLGVTVLEKTINVTGDRTANINVSGLTPGIYFILLKDSEIKRTQKFIKK